MSGIKRHSKRAPRHSERSEESSLGGARALDSSVARSRGLGRNDRLGPLVLALAFPALLYADGWWNNDWPYRVRINCKESEGDVVVARVALAGRARPDGRDLRLLDKDGQLCPFEVLHHDPRYSTLIAFKAPPDKAVSVWLYYGNPNASAFKTANPGLEQFQAEHEQWKQTQAQREEALTQRRTLDEELGRLRQSLAQAEAAGETGPAVDKLRQRISELEQQSAAIAVPDEVAEPKGPAAWKGRRGIVLRIYRKAESGHPEELRDLRKLINKSTLEGAGFRAAISDGFNPFGVSEEYISVYEGYLRIDEPGEYALCTVSDDGSWLLVDGKSVVEWPGAHGFDGSQRGERSGTVKLKKGVARVDYFQEEGTGGQMAFVGWKPPGAEAFSAIPNEQWVSVRYGGPGLYEARERPLLAVADCSVVSTYWIRGTEDKQASMVQFTDRTRSRKGDIVSWHWDFGDGLSGEGKELSHAYFRLGRPEVTLTVTDAAGNTDSAKLAPYLFPWDYVARARKYGEAKEYIEATASYDVEHMERDDLALYAEFCGNLEQWARHVAALRAYVARFADSQDLAGLVAPAIESCLQPQAYAPELADEWLRLALERTTEPRARNDLLLKRARVLAWHLDQPESAGKLYDELEEAAARDPNDPYCRGLGRACLIGRGDAALASADYVQAEALYRQAESLAEKSTTQQADRLEAGPTAARGGSYVFIVEDLLARGEYAYARDELDKWEDECPLQKLEGYSFFLRGKVLFVEHPSEAALRYLRLAERVAPRAVHVPETVWLRANCCLSLGRRDDARAELRRITVDFTSSEFLQRAAEKLREAEPQP